MYVWCVCTYGMYCMYVLYVCMSVSEHCWSPLVVVEILIESSSWRANSHTGSATAAAVCMYVCMYVLRKYDYVCMYGRKEVYIKLIYRL